MLSTCARALVLHVRLRRVTTVALLVCAIVTGAAVAVTVANLRGDPAIPRTRISLLMGCVCASLQLLMTRGIIPDAERLAVVSMKAVRLVVFTVAQLACFSLIWLAGAVVSPDDAGTALRVAAVTGALAAIAMLTGRVTVFAGLVTPWIYVTLGLVLGYDTSISGGDASVRPWAWLVDDSSPLVVSIALAAGATGVAAMLEPFVRDQPDDL